MALPKQNKGFAILMHKYFRNKITNWEPVSERIVTVNLTSRGYKMVIIGIYARTEDDSIAKNINSRALLKTWFTIGDQGLLKYVTCIK